MIKRFILFAFLALLAAGLFFLWKYRSPLLEKGIEKVLNQTQKVFFADTLDVEGVHLSEKFRLSIERIRGNWQAPDSSFPIEINQIHFQDSLFRFLFRKPIAITFENLRPIASRASGIQGNVLLSNDSNSTMEVHAQFVGILLEEITALDPDHLKKASGVLMGNFYLKAAATGDQQLQLDLDVMPPGGQLQARFFEVLKPYLPSVQKDILKKIKKSETVHYEKADLKLEQESPESVKVLLSILVPDYNLHLNLNMTLRVEAREVFLQLAELLGLVRIGTS